VAESDPLAASQLLPQLIILLLQLDQAALEDVCICGSWPTLGCGLPASSWLGSLHNRKELNKSPAIRTSSEGSSSQHIEWQTVAGHPLEVVHLHCCLTSARALVVLPERLLPLLKPRLQVLYLTLICIEEGPRKDIMTGFAERILTRRCTGMCQEVCFLL